MTRYPTIRRLLAVGIMTGLALVAATPARAIPALNRYRRFPIPSPSSNPTGITAGPDGNLWFTEIGANKVGRITTAGVITEFPLPARHSGPTGIAAGPDGALWFTEFYGNKIGRITT